ncbi:hypothetical protein PC129_g9882 [Phytophthora cactorum]|nr:hypothetical protein Pcac1_g11921 [Phytophthora cactorum]KAG2823225.1 hypothetical protein PC111_g10305 [Phytophthora cactorum]KAG2844947.1 hypothetical protein PC112_g2037 [Phytophthora cactorum]KAG2867226.1 hypothetical protein PC113_g2159 [Phytophthora cactorum]KAG2922176.1 hypothetical protein PC114_g5367 [Phytophthora cactorum]
MRESQHPDAVSTSPRRESPDMIERGFSLSAAENAPRPVRHRGRRKKRRPRAPSERSTSTETEVISVLLGDSDVNVASVREVKITHPLCDAASIAQLRVSRGNISSVT